MKCEEFEPMIFIYEELSEQEKPVLNSHLTGCAHCRRVRDAEKQRRLFIARAAGFIPESPDPSRLTDKVMTKTFPGREVPVIPLQPAWIRWLRYSYAAASIAIILFFYAESTRYDYPERDTVDIQSREASLASPSLEKIRNSRMDSSFSVYQILKQKNTEE